MISFSSLLLTIIFIVLVIGFTDFFVKIPHENRCEMTYMYQVPQYVPIDLGMSLMKEFPSYHLYVYGEGDYAESLALNEFNGLPVLFVPGNGGSYKQARSLASVSLMMAHNSQAAHFNYFTVDYNEELSAFIGDKLETQTLFLYHSIRKVLQLYHHVPKMKIILIGHSVGGILIKALLSKPYFTPYLSHVALVMTLATPHRSPAMPFDRKILDFYDRLHQSFAQNRPSALSHINFVSIGGSANDKLIRSDLVSLASNNPLDMSILTTAVDDVWASADHLCIVWCRQLMVKLNQLLFDLIDHKYNIIESSSHRQDIIDYHLKNRYFQGPFPTYRLPRHSLYSNQTNWILHEDRLVRLNISKLVSPTNHLFPLHERESIVLHVVGTFKHSTLSVCKSAQVDGKQVCIEDGLNLFDQVKLVPSWSTKVDRHSAHIRSQDYLEMGFTHLVLSLTPSSGASGSYSVMVDRFTTALRQQSISLPSLWSFIFTGGFFKPIVVFTKLISQEQAFFNISLSNVKFVWQSYYLTVQTKSCYRGVSTFLGYGHLSLQRTPELNEFHWPFSPVKGANQQFTLKLNRDIVQGPPPSLQLHLEPNCGFEVLARFSLIDSSSQMVKHYFTLLVPVIISTAILVVSVQLSNMMLLYSYSNEEWDKFKSQCHVDVCESTLSARKCVTYLSAPKVMATKRYFYYCYVQIVFYSVLTLVFVKSLYPWHDLANLAALPPLFIFLHISNVFLFAYSLIFCFTVLVHFLANNFASGINFVRDRAALVPTLTWPFSLLTSVVNLRWERICACLAVSSAVCAFFFLTQLVFYLVHTCFTLLMLVRIIEVNHLEGRIGRTTSSTFIGALYPVVYALMLVLAVLNIPQTIDSINDFSGGVSSGNILLAHHLPPSSSVLRISFSQFVHTLLHRPLASLQALIVILIYFCLHFNSLRLSSRLNSIASTWSQKWTNLMLVALAFGNLLIGVLAFEFINYSVLLTLVVITTANSALRRQVNARVAFKVD